MNGETTRFDLEASLDRLSDWLRLRQNNTYDHAEDSRQHHGLANKLRKMAALLDQDQWFYLEERFNQNPPPMVGITGTPVASPFNNAGRYKALYWSLRELAQAADELASEAPAPRTKPQLAEAANYFLHLWLKAGRERPSMYDKGSAVIAFKNVLGKASVFLSDERVRGILKEAFEAFDPHYCADWELLKKLMA